MIPGTLVYVFWRNGESAKRGDMRYMQRYGFLLKPYKQRSLDLLGIFASFVVLFDFALVITWFAAALMVHDTYFNNPATANCCGRQNTCSWYCCGLCPAPCCKQDQKDHSSPVDDTNGDSPHEIDIEGLGSAERWFWRISPTLFEHRRNDCGDLVHDIHAPYVVDDALAVLIVQGVEVTVVDNHW